MISTSVSRSKSGQPALARKCNVSDYDVHRLLVERGFERVEGEWFRCAPDGARVIFHYLVKHIRQAFPDVEIILRGDAGFYSPELLSYWDRYNLKYILGFSSNPARTKSMRRY